MENGNAMLSNGFSSKRVRVGGRKLALDILPEEKMAFRLMLEASQGHGMAGVKDWLQQKFGSSELVEASQANATCKVAARRNVITPGSVPEFVIPGGVVSHRSLKLTSSSSLPSCYISKQHEISQIQTSQSFDSWENNNNHTHTSSSILTTCTSETYESSRSSSSHQEREDRRLSDSRQIQSTDSMLSASPTPIDTNDDPGSAAAVSLPHLRTHTPYGFTTVKESPNTRRKESLFLGSSQAGDINRMLLRRQKISLHCLEQETEYQESSIPSTSLVPPASQSLGSSMNSLLTDCHWPGESQAQMSVKRQYERRRSSVPSPEQSESDWSTDSPNIMRRAQLVQAVKHVSMLGELKFSVQYSKPASTLKVSIIKAERLAKGLTQRTQLNIFVKACLLPDKKQRMETSSVKGTHDPHFNQELLFRDVSLSDLHDKALRLRVCNKQTSRKSELLGEIVLTLELLGLKHGEEVRMWRDLEPRSESQNLGCLNFSVKFEPREERLSVTVLEAKRLPRNTFTGLPDPYVQVSVKQEGRQLLKKQTRIRKSSNQPVFKETFIFKISPRVEDLKYTTVELRVMSKEKLRNDIAIGRVVLGFTSTEPEQFNHWNRILSNVNTEVQHWHSLCTSE